MSIYLIIKNGGLTGYFQTGSFHSITLSQLLIKNRYGNQGRMVIHYTYAIGGAYLYWLLLNQGSLPFLGFLA